MNKIIACLLSLTTAIGVLLLTIAGLLLYAPELLIGPMKMWIVVFCGIAALCMLVPLFIMALSAVPVWKGQNTTQPCQDDIDAQ